MRFLLRRLSRFIPVLTKTERSAVLVLILIVSGGTALRSWEHSGVKIGPVQDWETLRKLVLQSRMDAEGGTIFPCFVPPPMMAGEHWPQRSDSLASKHEPSRRSSSKKIPPDSAVNLNLADLKELQKLPGVGPGTAKAILAYRGSHGKFRTVEGLLEVKGIGPKKFAALKKFVRV